MKIKTKINNNRNDIGNIITQSTDNTIIVRECYENLMPINLTIYIKCKNFLKSTNYQSSLRKI